MHYSDNEITNQLNQGNKGVFRYLFDTYYKELVCYSVGFVISQEIAEEIVQDVFIRIWENRKTIAVEKSFQAYLFTSVRNRSINYLKSKYGKIRFVNTDYSELRPTGQTVEDNHTAGELEDAIKDAIQSLPPKCRIIFSLSRNAGLSTEEIAGRLHISKKTVHAQIGIAIQKIKQHLKNRWDDIPV